MARTWPARKPPPCSTTSGRPETTTRRWPRPSGTAAWPAGCPPSARCSATATSTRWWSTSARPPAAPRRPPRRTPRPPPRRHPEREARLQAGHRRRRRAHAVGHRLPARRPHAGGREGRRLAHRRRDRHARSRERRRPDRPCGRGDRAACSTSPSTPTTRAPAGSTSPTATRGRTARR